MYYSFVSCFIYLGYVSETQSHIVAHSNSCSFSWLYIIILYEYIIIYLFILPSLNFWIVSNLGLL